jgi:hypothetical protein
MVCDLQAMSQKKTWHDETRVYLQISRSIPAIPAWPQPKWTVASTTKLLILLYLMVTHRHT